MSLSRVNALVTMETMRPWLLALFGFWFVGCSTLNPASSDAEKPLVLWHAYESGGTEHRFLQESLARYQALHPEIRVKTVAVPFEPFANKISVSVPRGNGPDAFIFAHDAVGDWAAKGLVEPIGLWVEPEDLDSIHSTALAAFVYEGQLYGMPTTAKTLALYYSPKVVKTPAKTTHELSKQIRNYRKRNPGGVGLAYDVDDLFFHAPWLF
ncbi:MAG: extracellular solute-binding protein, partial [Bradymonadia bacterium]